MVGDAALSYTLGRIKFIEEKVAGPAFGFESRQDKTQRPGYSHKNANMRPQGLGLGTDVDAFRTKIWGCAFILRSCFL